MKVLKWLDANLEKYCCVVLMSVMTVIIFVQVVARYVFQNSLSWSEELARYIFIWLVYLGISYGCQMRKHIKIDAASTCFRRRCGNISSSSEICSFCSLQSTSPIPALAIP